MKLTRKKLNFVTCTTDFESLLLTTGHGSQHVQQSSSYNQLQDIADSADIEVRILNYMQLFKMSYSHVLICYVLPVKKMQIVHLEELEIIH